MYPDSAGAGSPVMADWILSRKPMLIAGGICRRERV